jgi:hypothetical protein
VDGRNRARKIDNMCIVFMEKGTFCRNGHKLSTISSVVHNNYTQPVVNVDKILNLVEITDSFCYDRDVFDVDIFIHPQTYSHAVDNFVNNYLSPSNNFLLPPCMLWMIRVYSIIFDTPLTVSILARGNQCWQLPFFFVFFCFSPYEVYTSPVVSTEKVERW